MKCSHQNRTRPERIKEQPQIDWRTDMKVCAVAIFAEPANQGMRHAGRVSSPLDPEETWMITLALSPTVNAVK